MEIIKAFVRTSSQTQTVELAQVALPEIGANEVLVAVQAFGVGIHDRYFIPHDAVFPYVIGTEAAGVIAHIGADVSQFKIGDRVVLTSILQAKGGCWAQYVAVPQSALIPMPDSLDFVQGAAIPIAGKTALESVRALDLREGQTLFVAGASGAIGTLVVQMAAAQGIRIIGSASRKNHDYLLSLGAWKAVDYSDVDWKQQVRQLVPGGVNAALAIQRETGRDSMAVVKDGGTVVTVSGDSFEPERDITAFQFEHRPETQQAVAQLISDVAEGRIRLVIERVYPFEQAIEALEKTETRHARGKLVVRVADE